MIKAENLPDLLTQQPFWLAANHRKIPVLVNSNIHITGDRKGYCQNWLSIRQLIEQNVHPWAVYLHNTDEPFITLDIDHGRDPATGEPADWIKPLFKQLGIHWNATIDRGETGRYPYIEVSSSGTGYHVLFKGTTDFGKRSWFATDQRGKDAPKLELIAHNNLITYTGNTLNCSGQLALPIEPLLDYLKTTYPKQHCVTTLPSLDTSSNDIPKWRQNNDKELTADQIADMLDRLDPDCDHDEWKQIGMAIHDWNSGQIGKDLWTQWSQGGDKFSNDAKKAIDSSWKGFRSGKGIGAGTLVKKAMDNGFLFPKQKTTTDKLVPQCEKKQESSTKKGKDNSDIVKPEKSEQQNNQEEGRQPPALATVTSISNEAERKRLIDDEIKRLIDRYNQQYVHVMLESKNAIMRRRESLEYPKQNEWIPMPIPEFKAMLSHERPIIVGYKTLKDGREEAIYKPPADVWLKHPDSAFCNGTTFWPQTIPYHNGRLNLFCGYAVDPIECPANDPDVQLWKNHLVNIVCQNDSTTARYVLNWLAHLFQFPHIKPKTGLILKGEQGTGKGTLITPILDILGVHGAHLFRPGSVSGRFNSILENKLLIFADEAVFNERKDCNVLKGLVSETSMETERKGLEAISQRNFSRVAMASDDEHPVRISASERRYLMLKLSDEQIQNSDYFARFQQARNNGLAGKLLYRLLKIDLDHFIPMDVPKTSYLMEEKIHHLKPAQLFIYEVLMSGGFSGGCWPARIDFSEIQGHFRNWLETNRVTCQGNLAMKLGRLMSAIGATISKSDLSRSYELNNLQYSRSEFDRVILAGSKSDWG